MNEIAQQIIDDATISQAVRAEAAAGLTFVALGSNLGDRELYLLAALRDIEARGVGRMISCSRFIETDAVGGPENQNRYLNAVARISTLLGPSELLSALLEIERAHGRERNGMNFPRTLDLDLLLYGSLQLDSRDLVLPHPRMWQRAFVMQPLAEVCDVEWLERVRVNSNQAIALEGI